MRTVTLALAAAAAAFTAPALADHGCFEVHEAVHEICVIPHRCVYYPENGDIRCDYRG